MKSGRRGSGRKTCGNSEVGGGGLGKVESKAVKNDGR